MTLDQLLQDKAPLTERERGLVTSTWMEAYKAFTLAQDIYPVKIAETASVLDIKQFDADGEEVALSLVFVADRSELHPVKPAPSKSASYCTCAVFKPNHLRIEPTCAFCDKPLPTE